MRDQLNHSVFDLIMEQIREMENTSESVGLFQQMPTPRRRRPTDEYTMNHQPKEDPMPDNIPALTEAVKRAEEEAAVATRKHARKAQRAKDAAEEANNAAARLRVAKNNLRAAQQTVRAQEEAMRARIPEPSPGIQLQDRQGPTRHYLDTATVVMFQKVHSGWAYTYVAIQPAPYLKWHISGFTGVDKDRFTWDELLAFIGPKGRETLTIVTEAKSVTP